MARTNVPDWLTNVVAVAGGALHSFALRDDGTLVVWGDSLDGVTDIPSSITNTAAIASRATHAIALGEDGLVIAWGNNWFGQTNVPAGLTGAVALAAGANHSLALRSDGTLLPWGVSLYDETNVPVATTNVVAIAAGDNHSLAVIGSGPPIVKVLVSNPSWSTNGFQLSIPTECGRVYRLEYKNSFVDGNWTALPLVAGNGCLQTLIDSSAFVAQRFYRVRRW